MQVKFPSRFASGRTIEAEVTGAPSLSVAIRSVLEHYAQTGQELHSVVIDAGECDHANLAGLKLINCEVRGSFKDANFSGAVIDSGSMAGSFDRASFKGAQVVNVTLDGPFSDLRAQGAQWSFCNMHRMLADNADFSDATFSNCKTAGMQAPGATFALTFFRATEFSHLLAASRDLGDVRDATSYLAYCQDRNLATQRLSPAAEKQAEERITAQAKAEVARMAETNINPID